jgi:hypothetical protein
VEQWNDKRSGTAQQEQAAAALAGEQADGLMRVSSGAAIQHAQHLVPSSSFTPTGARESTLLTQREASALAAVLPGRRAVSGWALEYSSEHGGFSLQSLYRAGASCRRSILVVEDFSRFVFGVYCTEPWRVNPRYQGSGECFVFQLRPHAVKFGWQRPNGIKRNDFFMLCSHDSVGFGGAPHFAIWLDSDLLHGNSGICSTFASPVLAGTEEFKVKALELWSVGK